MSDAIVSESNTNFYPKIFAAIKDIVESLLPDGDDLYYLERPLTDIEAIARGLGLTVMRVSPKNAPPEIAELLKDNHAILLGSFIIINEEKEPIEQLFSIAHEIGHFLLIKPSKTGLEQCFSAIVQETVNYSLSTEGAALKAATENLIRERPSAEKLRSVPPGDAMYFARQAQTSSGFNSNSLMNARVPARSAYSQAMEKTEKTPQEMANIVSRVLGKPVSDRKPSAYLKKNEKAVFEAMGRFCYLTCGDAKPDICRENRETFEEGMEKAIRNAIADTIREEIIDYFAANLLVPTEYLLLWEDKPVEKVAEAFGVTERCIKKRIEDEIELELKFITPQDLSPGVIIGSKAPLSSEELNSVLQGYCNFETER